MPFFLVPPVAGAAMLAVAWMSDLLEHPFMLLAWWLAGVCLQFVVGAPVDWIWLAGLLTNVVLALYLAIRLKLG